jgi:hypothetical protein
MADEDRISFYQLNYDEKPLARVARTTSGPSTMTFVSEPPDRMLFHPDVLVSMDEAIGVLNNDGSLVLTATNGTATYQHTDAHQGCLVFERKSWEPK